MRKLLFFIFLILTFTASAGNSKLSQKQFKKDIQNVKQDLKNNKNLEKCETTLRKYLSDSLYANDKSTHLLLTECLRKQYASGNEKMYLKEKVDTATIVRTNVRMFLAIEALDSLDAKPNSKGIVEPSYRKKHAEILIPYWNNILKGGIYFFAHSNWKEAWQCFDTYLDCFKQPLFSNEKLDSTQFEFASFLATMSACNISQLHNAQKYANGAIAYTPRKEMVLQRLADLCAEKKDTVHFLSYLNTGYQSFSHSAYFFPNIIDYYCGIKDLDTALKYANDAIGKDSLNTMYLAARHNIYMMMQRYDDALADGITLLNINSTLPVPNYNVACIYYEKAQKVMKQSNLPYKQRLKNSQTYYQKCKPYMEKYRELMPSDKKLWVPVLYEVYLNLNMGKEFDSLPQI